MPGIDGKPLTFVKIRLPNALLGFVASFHWSEVPFFQLLVGLRSERFVLSQPVLVSVTSAISWLDISPGHLCFPLIWCSHIPGIDGKPLTFVKIRLTKALLGFGASLHWSEVPLLQSLA